MSRPSEPAWISRALRPFTEVHQGEAVTALLLTANVFLLLSAYYVIKPVREALILVMGSGAEYKSYMSGAIAALLFVLVPLYGRLVDALPRIKLVIGVSLAFAGQLVLFYLAMQVPALRGRLGLVFYVWVGIFNMMVVAQFWAYANDLYGKAQGERLFPMVALGASLGAAVGSQMAESLIRQLGVPRMTLLAAAILVLCSGLFWLIEQREGPARAPATVAASGAAKPAPTGGFTLVLRYRYLLMIALFSMAFSWVNTNGEYMLGKLIKADGAQAVARGIIRQSELGEFIYESYAQFFFRVNVLGVLFQSFAVSRLVKWLRLPKAFLILPILALANANVVAFLPLIGLVKAGKVAENAVDYSLNNTLRHMLWLVTSPEMKYKAKQAVDTFCVRIGDVCSALSVWVCVGLLGLSVQRFASVSIVLASVWLLLALVIGRAYHGLETSGERLGE